MAKEDTAVVEFVLDTLPAPLLHALRTLAALDYPIDNKAAFKEALPKPQDDKDEVVAEMLDYAVGPPCFPLSSARNTFEKFQAGLPREMRLLSHHLLPAPAVSLFLEDLVTPERKRIEEGVMRWFGCRADCRRAHEDCLRSVSTRDEYGAFRCALRYQLCLNRCG